MYRDISKANSLEQLKQQYDLSNKELKSAVETQKGQLNKVENEVNNLIDSVIINLGDLLESQSDISLWFFSGTPTTSNQPYTDWQTPSDHYGDFYYDRLTGYVYKFTSTDWEQQPDEDLIKAMALTNASIDTTDNERKVFFQQPSPPYSNGDWWIKKDGVLFICQIAKSSGTFEEVDFIISNSYENNLAIKTGNKLTVVEGRVTSVEIDVSQIQVDVEANKYYVDSEGNRQLISQGLASLEVEAGNITTEVSIISTNLNDIQNNIENNYYTNEQTNTLVQNAETGLTNTFSQSGGNNLLRNTAPWFMTSDNEAEYWSGNIKQIAEPTSTSGYAILTQLGPASQSVGLVNGAYSISFKYKRLVSASECSVRYNGKTFVLNEDSGEIHSSGDITNGQIIVEIIANSNDGFEIYDLMLKHGTEGISNMLVWTQNSNESHSDTVNISDGITANSNVTNTKATMNSEGFKVINKTSETSVMEATSTGGLFNDLTSNGKSSISGLLIRKSGTKVRISGIKGV